jgi:fermentation-respiration switch protein FrsA (DUF1100 family)
MIAVAGIIFVLWLAAVAVLATYQRKLLYPTYAVAANEAWAMPGVTRVIVETADGERLRGYWKPPAPGGSVVVTFHGNASSAVGHAARFAGPPWSSNGWGFLAIAYRGYPGSTGSPNEDGLLADGAAAVAFVGKESQDAPILFHGHSLGTGVAVAIAAKYPSKGLYLEAPFDTMTAVATGHYPFVPGFILRDMFRSINRVPKVTSPILAVHGLADEIIPSERGRALAASAARGIKFIAIPGVGHNDVFGIRDVEAEAMFRILAGEQVRLP